MFKMRAYKKKSTMTLNLPIVMLALYVGSGQIAYGSSLNPLGDLTGPFGGGVASLANSASGLLSRPLSSALSAVSQYNGLAPSASLQNPLATGLAATTGVLSGIATGAAASTGLSSVSNLATAASSALLDSSSSLSGGLSNGIGGAGAGVAAASAGARGLGMASGLRRGAMGMAVGNAISSGLGGAGALGGSSAMSSLGSMGALGASAASSALSSMGSMGPMGSMGSMGSMGTMGAMSGAAASSAMGSMGSMGGLGGLGGAGGMGYEAASAAAAAGSGEGFGGAGMAGLAGARAASEIAASGSIREAASTAGAIGVMGAAGGARALGAASAVSGAGATESLVGGAIAANQIAGRQALAADAFGNAQAEAAIAGADMVAHSANNARSASLASNAYRQAKLASARDRVNVAGTIQNSARISDAAIATHDAATKAEDSLLGSELAVDSAATVLDSDAAYIPPVTNSLLRSLPYGRLGLRNIVPKPLTYPSVLLPDVWLNGMPVNYQNVPLRQLPYGFSPTVASAAGAYGGAGVAAGQLINGQPLYSNNGLPINGMVVDPAFAYSTTNMNGIYGSSIYPVLINGQLAAQDEVAMANFIRMQQLSGAGMAATYQGFGSLNPVPMLTGSVSDANLQPTTTIGTTYPIGSALVIEPRDSYFQDYVDNASSRQNFDERQQ